MMVHRDGLSNTDLIEIQSVLKIQRKSSLTCFTLPVLIIACVCVQCIPHQFLMSKEKYLISIVQSLLRNQLFAQCPVAGL